MAQSAEKESGLKVAQGVGLGRYRNDGSGHVVLSGVRTVLKRIVVAVPRRGYTTTI